MKLEQQVVSLELAKKLKELGVKQNSLWYYLRPSENAEYVLEERFDLNTTYKNVIDETGIGSYVSAYTVAELGEMLPRFVEYDVSQVGTRNLHFTSGKTIINNGWYVLYSDPHPANKVPLYSQHADTEADTRAKMLINLLENNLITL